MKKATSATAIGNLVEWYEYGIYSYTAGIIGAQFFEHGSSTAALLYAFAVFAISFFFRPLGGMIFGSIGDRFGRKKILVITILLMSCSTAIIGFIPNYESIGVTAPILLIIMRMAQGLAAGGEYVGASVFMNEAAPDSRRGLLTSLLEAGSLLGYIIGSVFVVILTVTLSPEAMHEWGWRIPFICSLPLALVGIYVRSKVDDTPTFIKMKKENDLPEKPLLEMFTTARKPLVLSFLCIAFANGAYYTLLTYLPSYFETQVGLSNLHSLIVTTLGMVFMLILIPTFGKLSDRYGKKPFLLLSALLALITAIPIIGFVSSGIKEGPLVGYFALGIIVSIFIGVFPSTLPLLFPDRVRNSAYGISYNISTAIFGGGAPFIITSLQTATGNKLMPAFFLMGTALMAITAIIFLPKTVNKESIAEFHSNTMIEKENMI
ncbi:MFS transporter [Neobacillus sedimentimangrovi]|jgi:MFS transporter, MHS family, proline/betaine transporter|uniref:MFS transporter n=1 Tax=Neobacillus sedimentimangrovi TaxID=2699460 RepID=A0ABS8QHM4_9BACI|nr:MFS transporter [Neobacillus sedimentimangrovi]MCD4838764.1 MFS transporter [Neobacillus sedimentimangrovi]